MRRPERMRLTHCLAIWGFPPGRKRWASRTCRISRHLWSRPPVLTAGMTASRQRSDGRKEMVSCALSYPCCFPF